MTSKSLLPVAFRGTTLFLTEHNGQPYVPMRPVVKGMGLDWKSQHAKIVGNPRFSVVEITTQLPGDDQARAVTCLPLRKLPGWMTTIHPNKVKPEHRDTIVAYLNECDDALWSYWNEGHAARPVAGGKMSEHHAKLIRAAVTETVADNLPEDKYKAGFAQMWGSINSHFRCKTYRELADSLFIDVMSLIGRVPIGNRAQPRLEGGLPTALTFISAALPHPHAPGETPAYLATWDRTGWLWKVEEARPKVRGLLEDCATQFRTLLTGLPVLPGEKHGPGKRFFTPGDMLNETSPTLRLCTSLERAFNVQLPEQRAEIKVLKHFLAQLLEASEYASHKLKFSQHTGITLTFA